MIAAVIFQVSVLLFILDLVINLLQVYIIYTRGYKVKSRPFYPLGFLEIQIVYVLKLLVLSYDFVILSS